MFIAGRFFRAWKVHLSSVNRLLRESSRLQILICSNLSDKVSQIAQRSCPICAGLAPEEEQFPKENFAVGIEPKSRQTLTGTGDWPAFQRMVQTWFEGKGATIKQAPGLCLAVTFILSTERPDKDLDNMAEAMCDAFLRAIGLDDRIMHHLDLVKLCGKFPEEYMKVRAQPARISMNDDINIPQAKHAWALENAFSSANLSAQNDAVSPRRPSPRSGTSNRRRRSW